MATITETDRKQIEEQAKKILDNFASALDKVKSKAKSKEEVLVSGFREEKAGSKRNDDFRKMMFSNAPHKSGDNLIAETKEW